MSDELAKLFLQVLGFRGEPLQVTGSILADSTVPAICDRLLGLLLLNGARLQEVNQIFDEVSLFVWVFFSLPQ